MKNKKQKGNERREGEMCDYLRVISPREKECHRPRNVLRNAEFHGVGSNVKGRACAAWSACATFLSGPNPSAVGNGGSVSVTFGPSEALAGCALEDIARVRKQFRPGVRRRKSTGEAKVGRSQGQDDTFGRRRCNSSAGRL